MADLADASDLADRLGRSLTDLEAAQADALLADASARVRLHTGQDFDQDDTTDRVRVRRGIVRLPQRPVTAVTSVADVDGNDLSFTWEHGDRVDLGVSALNEWEIEPRRFGLRWVDVTYSHGYESVPAVIVAAVCKMVLVELGHTDGVQSESLDGYSVSWRNDGPLPVAVKEDLDRFRREGGMAYIGP